MFIATLSGVISYLPAAWPTDITISGLYNSIASSIALTDFVWTVGIVIFITSAPFILSLTLCTASWAGLLLLLRKDQILLIILS